jgi:hypothetical protein
MDEDSTRQWIRKLSGTPLGPFWYFPSNEQGNGTYILDPLRRALVAWPLNSERDTRYDKPSTRALGFLESLGQLTSNLGM